MRVRACFYCLVCIDSVRLHSVTFGLQEHTRTVPPLQIHSNQHPTPTATVHTNTHRPPRRGH